MPALAAGESGSTVVTLAPARVSPLAFSLPLSRATPRKACVAVPVPMSWSATLTARLPGMAKPIPIEPEALEPEEDEPRVAIELVMPISLPVSSKSGPPEFPGLTAASIWMALVQVFVLDWLGCRTPPSPGVLDPPGEPPWFWDWSDCSFCSVTTGRLMAETIPVVTVEDRPSGLPIAMTS